MSEDQAEQGRERTIEIIVARLSGAVMWIACLAVTIMMLHVTADVIGRYVFRTPVPATFEAVQVYDMVVLVFLPFAYIARGEGHIFVELFTRKLALRKLAGLNVFTGLLTLIWVGLLGWYSGEEAVAMTSEGELRQISEGFLYVWPSRWAIPIGCGVMALAVLIRLGEDLARAVRR